MAAMVHEQLSVCFIVFAGFACAIDIGMLIFFNHTITRLSNVSFISAIIIACVWGSPMVPLVGNIFTICTNLITNGTIGTEICANDKSGNAIGTMVQMLPTNGTIGRTPNTRSGILDIIVYY